MKKLTIKTIIPVLFGAAFLALMAGCGAKSTNTDIQTYNGITKTVTTTTTNGKTTTEIVYTDESGKTLDEKTGEAAFESAKAEVEGAEESMEETTAEAADEEEAIEATLTIVNNTNYDITELYIPLAEDDNWGDNLLKDGAVLEVGADGTISMTYAPDVEFQLAFVNSEGEEAEFDPFVFGTPADPENVTLTLSETEDTYNIDIK